MIRWLSFYILFALVLHLGEAVSVTTEQAGAPAWPNPPFVKEASTDTQITLKIPQAKGGYLDQHFSKFQIYFRFRWKQTGTRYQENWQALQVVDPGKNVTLPFNSNRAYYTFRLVGKDEKNKDSLPSEAIFYPMIAAPVWPNPPYDNQKSNATHVALMTPLADLSDGVRPVNKYQIQYRIKPRYGRFWSSHWTTVEKVNANTTYIVPIKTARLSGKFRLVGETEAGETSIPSMEIIYPRTDLFARSYGASGNIGKRTNYLFNTRPPVWSNRPYDVKGGNKTHVFLEMRLPSWEIKRPFTVYVIQYRFKSKNAKTTYGNWIKLGEAEPGTTFQSHLQDNYYYMFRLVGRVENGDSSIPSKAIFYPSIGIPVWPDQPYDEKQSNATQVMLKIPSGSKPDPKRPFKKFRIYFRYKKRDGTKSKWMWYNKVDPNKKVKFEIFDTQSYYMFGLVGLTEDNQASARSMAIFYPRIGVPVWPNPPYDQQQSNASQVMLNIPLANNTDPHRQFSKFQIQFKFKPKDKDTEYPQKWIKFSKVDPGTKYRFPVFANSYKYIFRLLGETEDGEVSNPSQEIPYSLNG